MTHGRPDDFAHALERLAERLGRHTLGGGPFAYGLIDRRPVPLSPIGWLAWIRQHPPDDDGWRRVGLDVVATSSGDVEVSTVFLLTAGMTGPDALFETMVSFAGGRQVFARYPTWEAAERGHADVLEALRLYGDLSIDA